MTLLLAASPSASAEAVAGLQWEDPAVQQCLDLCSNVDLVYKLLIQEIQPVSSKLHLLSSLAYCLRAFCGLLYRTLLCIFFCLFGALCMLFLTAPCMFLLTA